MLMLEKGHSVAASQWAGHAECTTCRRKTNGSHPTCVRMGAVRHVVRLDHLSGEAVLRHSLIAYHDFGLAEGD